ncbi:MAG: hypothetical protein ABSD03_00095 [Vulcanimicrobiaceae bacterium]
MFVLGVTGMAGLLAVQNARVLGAQHVVGLGRDPAGLARAARAGAVAVPLTASLLRSRRIRITGSGLGGASIADIKAQVPVYMQLIADGRVEVPTQTFALAQIASAWAASANSGRRVVVVP